ncbi:putative proline dehydrogenase 1, mitochondrial-like [Apostichopus japonicus]|uniref:Proline dehydrogenase n=1 Tax=Stichopus japonicus TaxID=307972 RepID=A0A2G8KDV4_STIJA|nr:putative proline dehydrogenase 1, mitochondrial-like [Apostichopus japonicus]
MRRLDALVRAIHLVTPTEMFTCKTGFQYFVAADRHKQFQAYPQFADRREDVASARTYFYHDEGKCDENLDVLLNCIDVAGSTSTDGFAAIKLTALGRPQLLLNLSEVLTQTRNIFIKMVGWKQSSDLIEQRLSRDEFQRQLYEMGITSRDETGEWFTWMDNNQSGSIDLLDWDRLMQPNLKLSKLFKVPRLEKGKLHPILLTLTEEEEVQMKRMLRRIDSLAKRATEKNVRLMVDAEQTYFQPAISRLAIEMMRKFNKQKAVIFNTYQCYLKQCSNNLCLDLELSKREDFWFGSKLVRGAYMDQERKRAQEIGYLDPINQDYDATSQFYHGCLDMILNEISSRPKINVMVASHNEDTIRIAVNRMKELNISANDQLVYFGQLFGMCDQVSFTLGQAGYAVYKYVPYGPVKDVIPYLSRRAFENRGMLQGVTKERELLWKELKRRILNGEFSHMPEVV